MFLVLDPISWVGTGFDFLTAEEYCAKIMKHEKRNALVTSPRKQYVEADIKPLDDRHDNLSKKLIALSRTLAKKGRLDVETRNQARRHLNHGEGWTDRAAISMDPLSPIHLRHDVGECFEQAQSNLNEAEKLMTQLEQSHGH